ncbi:hypothetical protein [Rhodococcus sp. JS3073]|uniref:hypothetical protein n=1 Tax=Rhodococcus sp. JS3073 TaxID=3002901 RepID=UPI002286842A|nr:hypothetical protein [Rhodococcus sp. JS3073]WAM15032.1 hypothetical protein OYT95_37710 [Rhodococcus sp. JS3073]
MNVQTMPVSEAPEGLGRFRDAVDALHAFDSPCHRTDPHTALLFDSLVDDLIEAAQTAAGDTVPQRDIFAVIDTAISRTRPSL